MLDISDNGGVGWGLRAFSLCPDWKTITEDFLTGLQGAFVLEPCHTVLSVPGFQTSAPL